MVHTPFVVFQVPHIQALLNCGTPGGSGAKARSKLSLKRTEVRVRLDPSDPSWCSAPTWSDFNCVAVRRNTRKPVGILQMTDMVQQLVPECGQKARIIPWVSTGGPVW